MVMNPAEIENTHSKGEFDYLEKYGNRNHHHIPTCYEKCSFMPCQLFSARVTHIYDPSKFWMVIKYKELEIFNKYLFRFYYLNQRKYQMPMEKIEIDQYCVIFAEGNYYRGVIVNFPYDHEKAPRILVYCFDYGLLKMVYMQDIFYMNEKCYQVPQFSVRACLSGIIPKSRKLWTLDSVNEFLQLVSDKIMVGVVVNIDKDRQVLNVHIQEEHVETPVHKTLLVQNHAVYFYDKTQEVAEDKNLCKLKVKHPYLFPSHAALESGKVPPSLVDAEYQMQIACLSAVAKRYNRE